MRQDARVLFGVALIVTAVSVAAAVNISPTDLRLIVAAVAALCGIAVLL